MGGKTASKSSVKAERDKPEEPKYKCEDCFSEALMYCGILGDRDEPPANQLEQFDKAYSDEFYSNHIDPQGWRSPIKPRRAY